MERLESHLDTHSPEFKANAQHHRALADDLQRRLAAVRQGGGAEQVKRHTARGKLFVRERVERLLDPGTAFLELSPLAANGMYDGDAPCAGLLTGVGSVHGRHVMVVANDATVKGGTYYPLTVKKHVRAQEIALENRLPCVYLVDSGGAFLPLQAEVFPDRDHFGRIFYNQARASALGIPQVAVVMGSCTAGGAYVPAMSDETVIVKNQGTIFLAGPPLVKAATGEEVTAEELGGGDVHTRISGVADHLADDDAHALEMAREIVSHLGPARRAPVELQEPEPPAVNTRTCGRPPGPAPTMMSAWPSALISPTATVTPEPKPLSKAKKLANTAPAALKALTCGPPPGPAPVTMSTRPSPLTSPAATVTPPPKLPSKAKKLASSAPVVPLNALTCGPPPAPGAVMMSGTPSPFTSPRATRTPPAKVGS